MEFPVSGQEECRFKVSHPEAMASSFIQSMVTTKSENQDVVIQFSMYTIIKCHY